MELSIANYNNLKFNDKLIVLDECFKNGLTPYDLYKNYGIHNGTVHRRWKMFCELNNIDPNYSKSRKQIDSKIINGEKFIKINIPGYENYLINDYGKIYSLRNNVFFVGSKDKDGYRWVGLRSTIDGLRHNVRVHQAVLRTFGTNPPPEIIDPTVEHINGNVEDNRISNLRWLSRSHNGCSSYRHNRRIGEATHRKVTNEQVVKIFTLFKEGASKEYLMNRFNISRDIVDRITSGKSFRNVIKPLGSNYDTLSNISYDRIKLFTELFFTLGVSYTDRKNVMKLSKLEHQDLLENVYGEFSTHEFSVDDINENSQFSDFYD